MNRDSKIARPSQLRKTDSIKDNPATRVSHGGFGQFGGVAHRTSRKVSHLSNRAKQALQMQSKKTGSG